MGVDITKTKRVQTASFIQVINLNISAKTEYACIAVLELARSVGNSEPLRIRDIADKHGIPSRFLVQILLQLKGAGIVTSTRGAAGGYRLASQPNEISLFKVMSVIDGCQANESSLKENTAGSRVLNQVWKSITEKNDELLSSIDFAELVKRASSQPEKYVLHLIRIMVAIRFAS